MPAPGCWVTMNFVPAMVRVPIRCGPGLAPAEKLTAPAPTPLEPLVIVIHGTLLNAVQLQPVPLTRTGVGFPPLFPIIKPVAESVSGGFTDSVAGENEFKEPAVLQPLKTTTE